jgi:hypothetical protein
LDQQVQEKELEVQTKTTALTQTELDLANAVVLIQEKDKELANIGVVVNQEDQKIQQLEIKLAQKESALANLQSSFGELFYDHDNEHQELEMIKSVDPVVLTDHLGNPVATYYPMVEVAKGLPLPENAVPIEKPIEPVVPLNSDAVEIPNFGITDNDADNSGEQKQNPTNAGFGTKFPTDPAKGDVFLRVDYLPSKLFKWNEKKWIEVDKDGTDRYAYDEEYIKHLIDKLGSGEYDYDILSNAEQQQIERYLNGNSK